MTDHSSVKKDKKVVIFRPSDKKYAYFQYVGYGCSNTIWVDDIFKATLIPNSFDVLKNWMKGGAILSSVEHRNLEVEIVIVEECREFKQLGEPYPFLELASKMQKLKEEAKKREEACKNVGEGI